MADKKVVLSADSTCDLNEELKKQYDVNYYPFYINFRGKDYKDGVDVFPNDLFKGYYEDKSLPKTAASSIGEFSEHFKQFTDKGDGGCSYKPRTCLVFGTNVEPHC